MFNIKKYPDMPQTTIKITCKNCNKTYSHNIPTEIDVSLYPELHDQICDPDIFGFKCPKCKNSSHIFSPFMYKDSRRKIGIFVNTPNDNIIKRKYEILDSPSHPVISLREQYFTTRIVSCLQDLLEKRELLELHLDDRAAEILKYWVYKHELKAEEYKSARKIALNYYIDNMGNHFVNTYIDNVPLEQITINIDAFYTISKEISKKCGNFKNDKEILIDQTWAKNNKDIATCLPN